MRKRIAPLRLALTATGVLTILFIAACVEAPSDKAKNGAPGSGPLRIGLSMDTLKEERWQRDRDFFVERAKELGAEVLVQSADSDDKVQTQQAENLLTQGVSVLVVIPHNGEVAASIVEASQRQNVPVISYDRLIRNSTPDLYISFDNEKVGELQARYLISRASKGNYVLIGGAPTDNNATLFRKGQMNVLKPAIDRGDITIVADQWARDWLASEALRHTENALTQANNNVVAVVASNDGTAGGVVQALEEQKLAGKVLVSGQDADLAALQRIVAGTQSMTVYKPVAKLARRAAEAAVSLAHREKVQATATVNNGKMDVPSILLEPIVVDKDNIMDTVIKDGYQTLDEVYKNVPPSQRPNATAASHFRRSKVM
jgi:D-xylose transport system substrate-binding protein